MPAFSQHPHALQHLVQAALAAADAGTLVRRALRRQGHLLLLPQTTFDLRQGRLFLVAVGKAAGAMARAAADVLHGHLFAGLVISKQPPGPLPPPLQAIQAGHPVPDQGSLDAGTAVAHLLSQTRPEDLVLCAISGGTSALLSRPLVSLADWQALNRALLRAGCPIGAVNQVRQQFDQIKGGGLARLAAPATCASLILSDVIGNDLAAIGSGPTVPARGDPAEVRAIWQEYGLSRFLDAGTAARLLSLLAQARPHPPREHSRLFHHLIGDVGLAAGAAREAASELGFAAQVVTTTLEGEARQVGAQLAALACGRPVALPWAAPALPAPACLIFGGETTVTLQGQGFGGRNQELALAAAISLAGCRHQVVASFSSDGEDGSPPPGAAPVAGAWATGETVALGQSLGLDAAAFLADNDSFTFFQRLGRGHIVAPHGTNVNDLSLVLRYAA